MHGLANVGLGSLVGFLVTVILGFSYPGLGHLLGALIGGIVAGFIARGLIGGMTAGLLSP